MKQADSCGRFWIAAPVALAAALWGCGERPETPPVPDVAARGEEQAQPREAGERAGEREGLAASPEEAPAPPEGPEVVEEVPGREAEEPEEEAAPRPALASVRDLGVRKEPAADPAKELSEHARAFYERLGEVDRAFRETGKLPDHPAEPQQIVEGAARGGARTHFTLGVAARGGGRPQPASAAPRRAAFSGARKVASPIAMEAGALGVTTGGMQDIGQARKIIGEGGIPFPEAFTAEGLLSEHDIPLEGTPSGAAELYASASVAWARRHGDRRPVAVVQLGFGVDMEILDFHRPPLNLAVVVDVSGSMQGGKIEAVRKALGKLVDRLAEQDRLAVVLFNQAAWVPLASTVLDEAGTRRAREIASGIQAGGSTSIESGLRLGYEQVAAHMAEGGGETARSARVMLFTDARPNVGATAAGGFGAMMQGAAAKDIGLTAFGVGIDFGQELAYEIFQVRGANYFYLEDDEKIAKVFDEEFDFMVTPAAYDVLVMMVPAEGARVVDVLGVPDHKEDPEGVELRIPSLFFSKREGGGASLVALELEVPDFAGEVELALVDLSFLPVGSDEKIRQRLEAYLPAGLDPEGKTPYYSQEGAKKALLLADAVAALKAACMGHRAPRPEDTRWEAARGVKVARPTFDAERAGRAAEGLGAFADWFASQIAGLSGLDAELRLIEKLEGTLRRKAGLPPRPAAREVPEEAAPETSPPELEVF